MERARDHLLAGARLTRDQHGRIGGGDPADHPAQLEHHGALAEHVLDRLIGRALMRQPLDLALQREVLERAINRHLEDIAGRRLGQEVPRSGTHRRDRGIEPAVAGEDDRRDIGVAAIELLAQLDARHPGHLDIRDHDVDRVAAEVREALGSREHSVSGEPTLAKYVGQQDGRILFVIDDQDAGVGAGGAHASFTLANAPPQTPRSSVSTA